MKQNGLKAGDITRITVGVAGQAATMANYRPTNVWQAQFSIPFTLGAALAYGHVGPKETAATMLSDERIRAQADKVALVSDPEADSFRPGGVPARVTIETADGRRFQTWVPHPRGSPENPLSDDELRQKFMGLASDALGAGRAGKLDAVLADVERLDSVERLVEAVGVIG